MGMDSTLGAIIFNLAVFGIIGCALWGLWKGLTGK